ncbi:membrane-bound lytic murein transglycosylase MltC [Thalassomonas actiniarum]|uniref:Membrane-bound lytic murein transglycosylase MltC n=1 Tax=Thalassomonas actiniarum TaxID=485447 RepID=A0AAE9YXH5_9GAMM|nr:membrane-bound lytic murein transglycosylase MltC [Thalassomonas actiniarum]WDE01397.1 membrane-bound lytic murein transglycosylase MltC [Thalassomonas actiniarum]
MDVTRRFSFSPRLGVILFFTVLLCACTVTDQQKLARAILSDDPKTHLKGYLQGKGKTYSQSPGQLVSDLNTLDASIKEFAAIIIAIWGKDHAVVAGRKKLVKYGHGYHSKAEVDFAKGLVSVETVAAGKPLEQLKQAIVTTLLTDDNPAHIDLFSDKEPIISGKPYLFNQVLDHDGQAIAYSWRANRFADYLIKHKLKKTVRGKQKIYGVEIPMVGSHHQLRKQKYAPYVLAAANKYQIKPALIYAIIETESSFNPFAVSRANAYGLMQIVPATAGKDVYQKIKKKPGMPGKQTLFSARENIDIGTAYLHILSQQYLKNIRNSQSRHFAVISAYNGGAGNVFKTFSSNRDHAKSRINALLPEEVYRHLTTGHPKSESRRYLQKVTRAEQSYQL